MGEPCCAACGNEALARHGPDDCPCAQCAWLAAYLAGDPAARAAVVEDARGGP